jgi:hypothetical protein
MPLSERRWNVRRKIIAVYFKDHTEYVNIVCIKSIVLVLNMAVDIENIRLWSVTTVDVSIGKEFIHNVGPKAAL